MNRYKQVEFLFRRTIFEKTTERKQVRRLNTFLVRNTWKGGKNLHNCISFVDLSWGNALHLGLTFLGGFGMDCSWFRMFTTEMLKNWQVKGLSTVNRAASKERAGGRHYTDSENYGHTRTLFNLMSTRDI